VAAEQASLAAQEQAKAARKAAKKLARQQAEKAARELEIAARQAVLRICICMNQCCGSESGSIGSKCFWAFWIQILLSSSKNIEKNLDSYYYVTFFYFLSLKNDVNVPSKSNKQKTLFFVGLLKVSD
jgi:hypothetical protein